MFSCLFYFIIYSYLKYIIASYLIWRKAVLKFDQVYSLVKKSRDFPLGPMVNTLSSSSGSTSLISNLRAKIPHTSQPKKNTYLEWSNNVRNSIKTLKMAHSYLKLCWRISHNIWKWQALFNCCRQHFICHQSILYFMNFILTFITFSLLLN